jgi:predicted phosphoadenosine phosphosulfate sulfurtransferase
MSKETIHHRCGHTSTASLFGRCKDRERVEKQYASETCFLVGLRSEESLNRYRAVTRNSAVADVPWSSKTSGKAVRFYPLYDFTFEDIWTYLGKFKVKYNKIYDYMYAKGMGMNKMRVSNLIHEQSFHCLTTLQEFDFDTYEKLAKRLKGVHTAAKTAEQQSMYQTNKRPAAFKTWAAYRDFLLENLPLTSKETFSARFTKQKQTTANARQQCRQLLLNDHENNVPVISQDDDVLPLEKWRELL